MMEVLINCQECMNGNHDKCSDAKCLCYSDNHGVKIPTLKDGVKVVENIEPDNSKYDSDRLNDLLDNGIGSNTPDYMMPEIVKLLVTVRKIISKISIKSILKDLCVRKGYVADIDAWVEMAWSDSDMFSKLKQTCFETGKNRDYVLFEQGQLIEVSWYLMGRYHIKRIELNGNMLFFNDRYYESNAEQLIRRNSRGLLIKSKNGDMNEIVKMVEDSCKVITWKEIEQHTHLKCLKNGTYDIKSGVFAQDFSPDNIILNLIPHNYDEDINWNEINRTVSEIIPDKRDRQSYYDSLSIALHPYTGIDFQFGGIGQAGTGKSQICELSIMVLGDENVSSSPIHLVAADLTTQKDIAFKFLNIDMDQSDESIKNIDVLKRWITQDKFTARGIYEHNTTFRPMARICFMANNLYDIASVDDAEAIYERTHVIKMDNKFRGTEKQVRNIFKKIATEEQLNGFVTYLLKNTTDIFNLQRIHHPMNLLSVKEIWNTYGNRIKEFFETWCAKGEFREDQNDVWNRWISFANLKNYHIKDKKKFHPIFDEIAGNTPTKTRIGTGEDSKQVYAYHGFRLLRDDEVNVFRAFGEKQAQSSKSSILSLLNINLKNKKINLIEDKITELLELIKEDEE